MTTCYLVRHGTTAWVDENILHGITDIPLNDNGINQAKETAKALKGIKVDFLFSSPLSRAFQTAEIIGQELALKPIAIEDVKEMSFGWMEGTKFKEGDFDRNHSFRSWFNQFKEDFVRWISGESKKRFSRRVLCGWQKILDQSNGRDFVLVAHSGVIHAIMRHCFDTSHANNGDFYAIHPGAFNEILINKTGEAELIRLDEHAHLQAWYGHKE